MKKSTILSLISLVLILSTVSFFIFKNKIQKSVQKNPIQKSAENIEELQIKKKYQIILALGDSLTAGYNIAKKDSYPQLLQNQLNQNFKNIHTRVINAGISGSTTSSALARLKQYIERKKMIHILILALGANDGLRGLPISNIKTNLNKTIQLAIDHNIKVLLAGMKLPISHGEKYRTSFEKIFQDLAQQHHISFIPFLLQKTAAQPHLNLPDGIHPNEQGHQMIAQTIFPFLKELYND